jgi:hypothetical protein
MLAKHINGFSNTRVLYCAQVLLKYDRSLLLLILSEPMRPKLLLQVRLDLPDCASKCYALTSIWAAPFGFTVPFAWTFVP